MDLGFISEDEADMMQMNSLFAGIEHPCRPESQRCRSRSTQEERRSTGTSA